VVLAISSIALHSVAATTRAADPKGQRRFASLLTSGQDTALRTSDPFAKLDFDGTPGQSFVAQKMRSGFGSIRALANGASPQLIGVYSRILTREAAYLIRAYTAGTRAGIRDLQAALRRGLLTPELYRQEKLALQYALNLYKMEIRQELGVLLTYVRQTGTLPLTPLR